MYAFSSTSFTGDFSAPSDPKKFWDEATIFLRLIQVLVSQVTGKHMEKKKNNNNKNTSKTQKVRR